MEDIFGRNPAVRPQHLEASLEQPEIDETIDESQNPLELEDDDLDTLGKSKISSRIKKKSEIFFNFADFKTPPPKKRKRQDSLKNELININTQSRSLR
jgi:hypothetical protein